MGRLLSVKGSDCTIFHIFPGTFWCAGQNFRDSVVRARLGLARPGSACAGLDEIQARASGRQKPKPAQALGSGHGFVHVICREPASCKSPSAVPKMCVTCSVTIVDLTLVEIFTNISTYEQNSTVKIFFEHPNGENAPIYAPGPEAVA